MVEIAQLMENALASSASVLRKAAMDTLSKAPLTTTVNELMLSDAGEAMRGLTLADLEEALARAVAGAGAGPATGRKRGAGGRTLVAARPATSADSQSREEFMYRRILEVLADAPALTIGQIAKRIDVDTTELRGYLSWMRRVGKVSSIGRARATRYSLPDGVMSEG